MKITNSEKIELKAFIEKNHFTYEDEKIIENITNVVFSRKEYNSINIVDVKLLVRLCYTSLRKLNRKPAIYPNEKGIENYKIFNIENQLRNIVNVGWYFDCKNNKYKDILLVLVHGWGSGKSSSSGHSMIDFLPDLTQYGNVFIFDQAGHGESSGHYSLGILEHLDIINSIKFLQTQQDFKKIHLLGFCIGAYATLKVYQEMKEIDSCILDSMVFPKYIFQNEVIHKRIFKINSSFSDLTYLVSTLLIPDLSNYNSINEINKTSNLTMIYGRKDKYIPEKNAQDLINKVKPESYRITNAGHVRSYFQSKEDWFKIFYKQTSII